MRAQTHPIRSSYDANASAHDFVQVQSEANGGSKIEEDDASRILDKSLVGAQSSKTDSSLVTDVHLFSAALHSVTLFFRSKPLEEKYRYWAFKAFTGNYAVVYLFLACTSMLFAIGNIYVELLTSGILGDMQNSPPLFFIYNPPEVALKDLDRCELGSELSSWSTESGFSNNTFSICGLTLGNMQFSQNIFFFMHSAFAILWLLQYFYLKAAHTKMKTAYFYHPHMWYGISIVSWTSVVFIKIILFNDQNIPFSMMSFPIGYEMMLMMACVFVIHGTTYFFCTIALAAQCIGLLALFWFMLGQNTVTYFFMSCCMLMTFAFGARYMRSWERWNRHSFIMFERLVAAEIRTDLDDNPFKIGNLIDWARANSESTAGMESMLGKWAIRFNDIDFQDRVAAGGSGIVWWGRYQDQKVAIKEIFSVMTSTGLQVGELEEFGNEVRVLRALADTAVYHPGLLKFFGVSKTVGESAPRLFMVMEWCSMPLDAILSNDERTPLPGLPRACDRNWVMLYSSIIASAVEWIHQKRVVHRDLKPTNILLQEVGEHDRIGAYIDDKKFEAVFGCRYMKMKLADFGLAVLDNGEIDLASVEKECGTPGFMAPELFYHISPAPISTREEWQLVDAYALGITLAAVAAAAPDPFSDYPSLTGTTMTTVELSHIDIDVLVEGLLEVPNQLETAIRFGVVADTAARKQVSCMRPVLLDYFWNADIGDNTVQTQEFVAKVMSLHGAMCPLTTAQADAAIDRKRQKLCCGESKTKRWRKTVTRRQSGAATKTDSGDLDASFELVPMQKRVPHLVQ